jgi:hypothetical protein
MAETRVMTSSVVIPGFTVPADTAREVSSLTPWRSLLAALASGWRCRSRFA